MTAFNFITNLPGTLSLGKFDKTYLEIYGLSLEFISRLVVNHYVGGIRNTPSLNSMPESLLFYYAIEHNRLTELTDHLNEYTLMHSIKKPNMEYIAKILHRHYVDITDKLGPVIVNSGLRNRLTTIYVGYCTPTEILLEINYV